MIQATDLVVDFPSENQTRRRILNGIDVTIADGELIGIMGANGSGKTTLARCLNGLIQPSQGKVLVDGLDSAAPADRMELRRRVGMVFQNPENQIVATSVEREIAFGLENLGTTREVMHAKVDEMLTRFDLQKYRHQPPHLLSGGETQRLALASVVVMEPKYLIFDEPTSLLDGAGRRMVRLLIHDLRAANSPVTVLFITQFPEEALFCERLIILHAGRVAADGPPEEIFRDAAELAALGVDAPAEYSVLQQLAQRVKGHTLFDPAEFQKFIDEFSGSP